MQKSILLGLSFLFAVSSVSAQKIKTPSGIIDPVSLTSEPNYFVNNTFELPPGRIFVGRKFDYDASVKNMKCVELNTLGVRFGTQNFRNCINLVVSENSKLEKKLLEIRKNRQLCKLTIKFEKKVRLQGGLTQFPYYLGTVKEASPVKVGKYQRWNDMRSIWKKNIGKTFFTYLWFKALAPKEFRKCGNYTLLNAESEKGYEAGSYKTPGRNITPAIPEGKKSAKSFLNRIKKVEGFCLTEIKIAETEVNDKYAGKVKAGLAVIGKLKPLKVATDFGAQQPLKTQLAKLNGTQLTDSAALFKTPRHFIGHEHKIIGRFNLDSPFTKDKGLKDLDKVQFSSYGGSTCFDAKAGRIAFVTPNDSAVKRTLKTLKYQTRGVLTINLEERKRNLGGIIDVGYYIGKVTGVKLWNDESWFKFRNDWKKNIGKTKWIIAKIEDPADQKFQLVSGYILLKAKSTTQHSAGNPGYLSSEINLAIKDDDESKQKLANILEITNGFCRLEVKIKQVDFKDKKGKEGRTGIALIKSFEPMKTAENFVELPSSFEKEDINLTWNPFQKLTPSKRDIEDWFKKSRAKIKRLQYDDYKKQKEPNYKKGDKYRYKEGKEWVYQKEMPIFKPEKRPHKIWQKGTRKVRRSNSHSYISGTGGGGYTITTISYGGASYSSVPTWHRMLYNEKNKTWEKADTKLTLNHVKNVEKQVQAMREKRNQLVKIILDVEENNIIKNRRDSIARNTEMYDRWEKDPSRNNPAAKKRIKEERIKLARDKKELEKLEQNYKDAINNVKDVNGKYQQLLDEVESFAEGRKELLKQ